MKKNYIFFLFLLLCYTSVCFSQKETDKWYISGQTALDFSSGTPVPLNNNAMVSNSYEGCATISDASGNLLFYADGVSKVYNKNHFSLPNGSGVLMHNSATQGVIFIPKPASTNIYYLIYLGLPTLGSPTPYNLYYSEIDLSLNGGLGDITSNKNIVIAPSFGNCSEKMCVTKHCNGIDYWVLVHNYSGNEYKCYLVSAAGVNTTPISSIVGTSLLTSTITSDDAVGQMKFSPNGTKVAILFGGPTNQVELLDFNKTTGIVSNPVNLGSAGSQYSYGLEFSPDNSKIYASGSGTPSIIKQWNLSAGLAPAIIASGISVGFAPSGFSLQLANDNKIYLQKYSNTLGVINNPNVVGAACGYSNVGVILTPAPPTTTSLALGLPSFISSYFDKPNTYTNASVISVNTTNCQDNGSAAVTASWAFGTFPYTYTWSTGTIDGPTNNLTSSISNLSAGNYSVIISDATCIKDTINFTIFGGGGAPYIQNASICGSAGYVLPKGTTVYVAGTYHDTLISSGGCDSIIITNLTVGTSVTSNIIASICSGKSYTLPHGSTATTTGIYKDTLASIGGCDSIITTNLTVTPASTNTVNPSICLGNTYTLPKGNSVSSAGTYIDTLKTAVGCDSIITTNLTVIPASTNTVNPSICLGNTYTLPKGNSVSSAGTYIDTLKTAVGCDSIITTVLSVITHTSNVTSSICMGSTYTLPDGAVVTAAGTYVNTIPTTGGCDSTITTHLTITQFIVTIQNPIICSGNNYTLPKGFVVNTAGMYTDTIKTTGNCDSVFIINLSITPPENGSQTQSICTGETYTLPGGGTANITGTYMNTIKTLKGCDSIVTTYLTVLPNSNTNQTHTICIGENFVLPNGTTVNTSGTYNFTSIAVNGCDSIVSINLQVNSLPNVTVSPDLTITLGNSTVLNATGGGTYAWSPSMGLAATTGNSVTASPTLTTTYCVLVNSNGCIDSACVLVDVEKPCFIGEGIEIPNAFSPNNDGVNDEFCLQGLQNCIENFSILIYDRWGEKVFESKDPVFCWDGKLNGKAMDAAVFVFYFNAKYKNRDGVIHKSGNISLIR